MSPPLQSNEGASITKPLGKSLQLSSQGALREITLNESGYTAFATAQGAALIFKASFCVYDLYKEQSLAAKGDPSK